MVVKCIANRGNEGCLVVPFDYKKSFSDENFETSKELYTISREISGYFITPQRKYTVFGLLIFCEKVRYLISDDNGLPNFFPSDLFEVFEPSILFDWEFRTFPVDGKLLTLIGYSDLVEYDSFRDLIRHKPRAVESFLKYKTEVSERS